MAITAALVKELRQLTGVGMMDCKRALVETDGDVKEAAIYLQKKGMAKASKKAGRVAAEGLVTVATAKDKSAAVLVEVNCETDFVCRNDAFKNFTTKIADYALAGRFADLEQFKQSMTDEGTTIDDWTKQQIAGIGENIMVRRLVLVDTKGEGVVSHYVHSNSQLGVLVEVAVAGTDADVAYEFGRNVAMHVCASNPEVIRTSEIDQAQVAKQNEIFSAQAASTGKPANIIEKIVSGRIAKWQKEIALLEQPYVKDPDITVAKYQKQVGGVEIKSMHRCLVGEGIEKRNESFADEVAAMTNG